MLDEFLVTIDKGIIYPIGEFMYMVAGLAIFSWLVLAAKPTIGGGAAIDFSNFWSYFLVGVLGAASLEGLKLFEYSQKLRTKRFYKMMKSGLFWAVVALMLFGSGFFAWALNCDSASPTVFQIATAGVAMRSMIRQGVESIRAKKGVDLGGRDDEPIDLDDIF